ncbi:MAG: PAS domain S-box protein [Mycobacterium sp.]
MTTREPAPRWAQPVNDVAGEYRLRRAADDAAVESWALLKAVRDSDGRIVDFLYQDINRLGAGLHGLQREDLLGRSVAASLPELARSGIFDLYVHCVDTGKPLILDDLSFYGRTLHEPELQTRRYELRGVRVETEYLSLHWRDVDERYWTRQQVAESEDRYRLMAEQLEAAHHVLRATVDSMLDPQMLLQAVRDPTGRVIDFQYREANAAACKDMATTRDELVGRTVLELLPGFAESGPMSYYIQCLESGQPGALDDYSYDHEIQADSRRYDIRIAPAGQELISLTFRDVTDRFQAAQRAVAAQTLLRATVDSMLDPQMLLEAVRDPTGRVTDFTYRSANRAFASYRGWEEREIIGRSLLEAQPSVLSSGLFGRYVTCVDTGEPVILDDFEMFNSMLGEDRRFDIRVVRAGVDLISLTFSDVTERSGAARRIASSERAYRLLAENSSDMVTHVRDGRFAWTSPSVADVVGASPEYWVGRPVLEIIPPEDEAAFAVTLETLAAGGTVRERIRVVAVDGVTHWADLHARPLYGDDGQHDGFTGALRIVDAEVAAQQDAEEARRQQVRADALYRRSVDSAAVGMCLINTEGDFVDVNEAVCEFFGYDADTLKSKTWHQLTPEAYTQADRDNLADLLAGRIESYRMTKPYIHAHGHPIWGDLSVGCVRDGDGHVEVIIVQINDITAEVQSRERLVISEERNRVLAQGLQSELSSAAKYLQSVLPSEIGGQVSVSTRYLPSNTLGGDCFDFRWIDDDHFMVYLLDVSGHGVESALIAVSVHNMLRSASFTTETMLQPDRVLETLNRQFGMDRHGSNYFTIFYGVYQRSSATLRYANAGHPPALVFTGGQVTELSSQSLPVGMFGDTPFATVTVPIPPGSQILLYSDGVYEVQRVDGGQWPRRAFLDWCTHLGGSPGWTLDDVIDNALDHSATGSFDDDCCLVRLTFD